MADAMISLNKIKAFWNSQVNNEENWAVNSGGDWCNFKSYRLYEKSGTCFGTNVKLLRAAGLFAGSIILMRNFGDLMAI